MGSQSTGLSDQREDVERLRTEIESVRGELSLTVAELDRRRHHVGELLKLVAGLGGLLLAVGIGLKMAGLVPAKVLPERRQRKRLLPF